MSGDRDTELDQDNHSWTDAMQVGSDPVLEIAQALLAESQPHMQWRSASVHVQVIFREKAATLVEACPSLRTTLDARQTYERGHRDGIHRAAELLAVDFEERADRLDAGERRGMRDAETIARAIANPPEEQR